jgi:protein involved in polysaccharide export with SLBB domain
MVLPAACVTPPAGAYCRLPMRTHGGSRAVVLGAILFALAGCTRRPAPTLPDHMVVPAPPAGPYRVQPGDVLAVKFKYHPDEDVQVTVRPDGGLAAGIAGDIQATGLTGPELEEQIRNRAARYLRDPFVSVGVVALAARVYIGGEVANAGWVSLAKPMTVLTAVMERGGFTRWADLEAIYVMTPSKEVEGNLDVRRLTFDPMNPASTANKVLLTPQDVVVVPRTGIGDANLFVEQWINGLTPELLRGVRFPTVGGSTN